MKVINIHWTPCLIFCIVVIYLLLTLTFLSLYVSKNEPVLPVTSHLTPKHNHLKIETSAKPEILTAQPQLNAWKQSSLINSDITPQFLYKGGRKDVMFVIGVPTVARPKRSYVLDTIDNLIQRMTPEQRKICLIVIYVGETSLHFGKLIVKELRVKHGEYLKSGLIDVIAPQLHYYPNFTELHTTMQDDPQRVRWRTKQNLDYIYLMSYAQSKGSYYLQLEDDIIPNEGFLNYIEKSALMHGLFRFDHQLDWIAMSFSDLGFVGKLFPSSVLQSFITHLQLFCDHQSIESLLQSFVTLQSCRWDSISEPDCERIVESRIIQVEHSQFQHMGKQSSLKQKSQQHNVVKQRLPHLHQSLDLVASHHNSLLRQNLNLQPGETFIWMYMPQMPKMMENLISNQNKGKEIRIRNHKEAEKTLPEFSVELVEKLSDLDMNATLNPLCGFLMSHTLTSEEKDKADKYMFYYIKEDSEDTLTWFRSFLWAKDGTGRPSLDWFPVYIWAISSFYAL
ncbi:alpha-1,3-mannosyl-glycoprotein 4-beta-N-acetylglucosaminyltransferase A [Drosophila serrata]|uniref:alpha-1,3-mannosyl-glycoprotein 4-beta-N-acetylglucosaminyltransferase A n=1 Tax=Drosophila serrata TaxID=7274 RepID=UPI000A1D1739|nr:alpha-1,3-mannosyl-glycoprotein 4-beta-N-acetylglucosaminyltransferase A [Drosophila serrata]